MRVRLEMGPGTQAALGRLTPEQGAAAVLASVNTFALALTRSVREKTPAGVGALRNSWLPTVRPGGGGSVELTISNRKHYAAFVEYGTGIHGPKGQRIFPKTKKALSWKSGRAPSAFRAGPARIAAHNASRVTVRSTAGMRPRRPFKLGFEAAGARWAEIVGREIERRLVGGAA